MLEERRLQVAIELAERRGYTVRQDWLEGVGGGYFHAAGRPWIFLDMSLDANARMKQLGKALAEAAGFRNLSERLNLIASRVNFDEYMLKNGLLESFNMVTRKIHDIRKGHL